MSFLPPVAMEITAHAAQFYAEMGKVSASVDAMAASSDAAMSRSEVAMAKMQGIGKAAFIATAAGAAVVGAASIDAAMKFEKSTTLLVTAGGESKAAIGAVRDGILAIAASTGTSTEQLSEGMYVMEKAGYHGADGLNVLKAAAEGAKAENVDLATMTQAVSDVMLDYHQKASDATSVTNEMVAASGLAKTTMQDFAGSMASIIPIGSAMGISFDQLGGAIATMTQHGESAQQSTQNLANLVQNLSKPSNIASSAMNQLGINVTDLSSHLGERGLTGTLKIVTDAITAHMGPAGMVIQDTMKKSSTATQDLQSMMEKMPAGLQTASKAFLDGSMSMKDYQKEFKGMGAEGDSMGKQFLSLANTAKGYNDQIKGGTPEFQTYNAELSKMTGGITGLKTSLMLTGENASIFSSNVAKIGQSAKQSGSDISTWGDTSATTAVKLDQVKETVGVLGIKLGGMLLPAVKSIADGFLSFTKYLSENQPVAIGLGVAIGTLAVGLSSFYVVTKAVSIAQDVWKVATLAAAGAQWVLNAAMDANPIGIVVLAIAALVGGIILAYNNIGWFKDGVNALGGILATFAINTGGMFVDFFTRTAGMFVDFFNNTVGMFTDWGTGVAGMFTDFFNHTVGMFVDFFNNTVGMFRDWGTRTVGMFTDFVNNTVGMFRDWFNGVVGMVKDFVAGFVAVFKSIVTFLMPVINMVKAILSVFGAIFNFVGGLIQIAVILWIRIFTTVATTISAIFTNIASFVVTVWNSITGAIGTAVNATRDVVTTVLNAVASFVTTVFTAIGSFVATVWNAIVGWVTGAVNAVHDVIVTVWTTISGFISTVLGAISDFISTTWNAIVGAVSGPLNQIWGFISSTWNKIVTTTTTIWGQIVTAVSDFMGKMGQGVSDGIGKVVGFFGGLLGKVMGAIGDAGTWLFNVGKDIITGLINGITSMAQQAAATVAKVGSDILGSIKGALGIHSPSRRMHEVGQWIMQGLSNGIDDHAHLALNSMANVAAGISGGINIGAPQFAMAGTPAASPMGTLGNPSGPGYSPLGPTAGNTSTNSHQTVQNINVQVAQTNATGQQIARDIGYTLLLQS